MISEDVRERAIEHGVRALNQRRGYALQLVRPNDREEVRVVLEAPGVQWAELVEALAEAHEVLVKYGFNNDYHGEREIRHAVDQARALLAQMKDENDG